MILCYPRVGNRYLNEKIRECFNPHPSDPHYNKEYQKQLLKQGMHVLSTHDRNVEFLYKHNELKNTDIFIHLIANPFNSVASFFNRWPQMGYEKNKNPGYKIADKLIRPLSINIIEKCHNSFAIDMRGPDTFFSPAPRPGITINDPNDFKRNNYQELMLRCDFLQYEHHFDRIINNNLDIKMITLKYETMSKPKNIDKLRKFLGFGFDELNFDDFKLRKTDWRNSVFKNEIENVYGSLYEKYNALPDVKIWR
jgi:hypothetical protein